LQVFIADVAKIDRNFAHVAIVVHVCCRLLFPNVSSAFFQTYVTSVFIRMLHMFHAYIANVLSECCVCFTMVLKCFSCVFASVSSALRMLYLLHLDFSKVDRILHLLPRFLLPRLGVSSS
jgi:hypothetical protein